MVSEKESNQLYVLYDDVSWFRLSPFGSMLYCRSIQPEAGGDPLIPMVPRQPLPVGSS